MPGMKAFEPELERDLELQLGLQLQLQVQWVTGGPVRDIRMPTSALPATARAQSRHE